MVERVCLLDWLLLIIDRFVRLFPSVHGCVCHGKGKTRMRFVVLVVAGM